MLLMFTFKKVCRKRQRPRLNVVSHDFMALASLQVSNSTPSKKLKESDTDLCLWFFLRTSAFC